MRQSTVKATRREIRRTLGESGLAVVNGTAHAVNELQPTIRQQAIQLQSQAEQIELLKARLTLLEVSNRNRDNWTFAQRVWWLVQGKQPFAAWVL